MSFAIIDSRSRKSTGLKSVEINENRIIRKSSNRGEIGIKLLANPNGIGIGPKSKRSGIETKPKRNQHRIGIDPKSNQNRIQNRSKDK